MQQEFKTETDLKRIEQLGRERENENNKFGIFLTSIKAEELDKIVHRYYHEFSEQIDCTECGNCCEKLEPYISGREISRLSKRLNIKPAEFRLRYTEPFEDEVYFKNLPCSFQKDKKCTVYEDRPSVCREFPHIQKKDFKGRLIRVIDNYSLCPIIFNVYEKLKIHFDFRQTGI